MSPKSSPRDTLLFSNNIASNFQFLTGTIGTFNDRLNTSRNLLDMIGHTAYKAGLSGHDLGTVVQRIAAPMAAHGRLGHNYSGGINMARNIMLSGEAMGIHPQVMTETIARAMTDNMGIHGAVFQRLVNTQAFRGAGIRNQMQLQHLDGGKKIDLLNKALEQLGGNADYVRYRMNLISVQFERLKENLSAILKPIGDAIIGPMKMMLRR